MQFPSLPVDPTTPSPAASVPFVPARGGTTPPSTARRLAFAELLAGVGTPAGNAPASDGAAPAAVPLVPSLADGLASAPAGAAIPVSPLGFPLARAARGAPGVAAAAVDLLPDATGTLGATVGAAASRGSPGSECATDVDAAEDDDERPSEPAPVAAAVVDVVVPVAGIPPPAGPPPPAPVEPSSLAGVSARGGGQDGPASGIQDFASPPDEGARQPSDGGIGSAAFEPGGGPTTTITPATGPCAVPPRVDRQDDGDGTERPSGSLAPAVASVNAMAPSAAPADAPLADALPQSGFPGGGTCQRAGSLVHVADTALPEYARADTPPGGPAPVPTAPNDAPRPMDVHELAPSDVAPSPVVVTSVVTQPPLERSTTTAADRDGVMSFQPEGPQPVTATSAASAAQGARQTARMGPERSATLLRPVRDFAASANLPPIAAEPVEKLAASEGTAISSRGSGEIAGVKSSVQSVTKEVSKAATFLGTGTAEPAPTMPAGSTLARSDAFPVNAAVGGTAAGADNAASSSPIAVPGSAHHAVEAALNATEWLVHAPQHSVNLRFEIGGADLNVRVALRGETVHTTFQTDSADLRYALSTEWQAVVGTSGGDRPVRLAAPVFGPSDQGSAPFSGDATPRQHDPSAHRPEPPARGGPAPTVESRGSQPIRAAGPTVSRAISANSIHLHTLA